VRRGPIHELCLAKSYIQSDLLVARHVIRLFEVDAGWIFWVDLMRASQISARPTRLSLMMPSGARLMDPGVLGIVVVESYHYTRCSQASSTCIVTSLASHNPFVSAHITLLGFGMLGTMMALHARSVQVGTCIQPCDRTSRGHLCSNPSCTSLPRWRD
jgi:hypothetical protein